MTLRTILGGDFLTAQMVRHHIGIIVLIVVFAIVYVAFRYQCQQDMIAIDKMEKELTVLDDIMSHPDQHPEVKVDNDLFRSYGKKKEELDKAQRFMAGRGAWMGFFAFLPILGSAITIMLGFMRANFIISMLSITIGKLLRYVILVYGADLFI